MFLPGTVKNFLELDSFTKPMAFLKPYLLRHRKTYSVLICILCMDIAITLFFAWFLKNVTDYAVHGQLGKLPFMFLIGLALIVVNCVLEYGDTYLASIVVSKIKRDIRTDLFDHIFKLSGSRLDDYHSGELVSHLTNDIDKIQGVAGGNLLNLLRLPLMSVSIFVYLVTLSWQLSLLFVILGPVAILSGAFFGKMLRKNNRLIQDFIGQLHRLFNDVFSARTVVRSFSLESWFSKRSRDKSNELLGAELKIARLRGFFNAGAVSVGTMGYLLSLGLGAVFVSRGMLTVGTLVAFVSLFQQLMNPMMNLAAQWANFQRSLAALDRIVILFDQPVEDIQHSSPLPIQRLEEDIKIEDLSFSYDNEMNALESLNITIQAGKVTALIGESGAGKSTFMKLLHGLYKQNTGTIRFGNERFQENSLLDMRRLCAYVPQETLLFQGTIKENIAFGRMSAAEHEIRQAAIDANAHDFIMALPAGYETDIGESGMKLSGGQKQRIAIARALLKNAPVLLMDEATSALDSENEFLVKDALKRLMKGRTTILIAHRLSTVKKADNIIVFKDGHVIEEGNHEALISRNGAYRSFYSYDQNHGEEKIEKPYVESW